MHIKRRFRCWSFVLLLMAGLWSIASPAQELAPRAYWPTPNGLNVLVFGYQNSFGDVLTDPALPVAGVESDINFLQINYQRTFSWFSRTATVQLSTPYSWGKTEGLLEGEYRYRKTSGFADTRIRLAINLLGAPSMDSAAFRKLLANPRTIVGVSLLVQIPTGEYQADKLINIGTNRWAVKPGIGIIWPVVPSLLVEFDLGAWFYGNNDDFLGQKRSQDPVLSSEFHLIKVTRPGIWASLDVNFYGGGRSSVGDITRNDLERNSRIGGTLFFPWQRQHGVRASYSKGLSTSSGGDFTNIAVAYTYAW